MVRFSDTDGLSIESAIVITNAPSHQAGVGAEYDYIAQKHGQRGRDWQLTSQSLQHHNGRAYDQINIVLADGAAITYYFDISAFFGNFEAMVGGLRPQKQESFVQRIVSSIRRLFGG